MSKPFELHVVDAFCNQPFSGNPAAVVLMTEQRDEDWMQAVAAEMNLSETAFLDIRDPEAASIGLRWFTPTAEVALCGHATLAAAHVLGRKQTFQTLSGELHVDMSGDGVFEMNFPADPSTALAPDGFAAALGGIEPIEAVQGKFDKLLRIESQLELTKMQPDIAEISALSERGLIVTALADDEGVDFVSRCFYPNVGIPEDPVTDSAHCTLASYWSPRLERASLTGAQLSRRGGVVHTRLDGDRVHLSGSAVTISSGSLLV